LNIKKQEKLFKEPEEQITILEEERNLTIDDKERATSLLARINYYNFRELFIKFLLDLSKSIDEIAFKYVLNDMGFNDGDLKIESYDDVVKYI